ncbi:MAG: DMT family transporter [bacterium]
MPFIGEIAALGGAILWAFSSFLFTEATIRLGVIQLNIDRLILAILLLLLTIFVFSIGFSTTNTQMFYLFISGIIGLVLGDTFLLASFKSIGPRITMLIMSFNPAVAAIFAYFMLGETLGLPIIIGMALTLAGITLVVMEKPKTKTKFKVTPNGVIFAFLGAFGQAFGLVFSKMAFLEGDINSLTASLYRMLAALLIIVPLGIIMKQYRNPIKIYIKDKKLFLLVTIGSIIGPYLGITLSFIAAINTKIGVASTLLATVPILMLPLSHYFYKEKLSFRSIAGAVIAVLGVQLLFLF